MQIEYRGNIINVEAKQKNELWAADIQVWPRYKTTRALRDMHEVEGYRSQGEAEEAGRLWAESQIDGYTENRLTPR